MCRKVHSCVDGAERPKTGVGATAFSSIDATRQKYASMISLEGVKEACKKTSSAPSPLFKAIGWAPFGLRCGKVPVLQCPYISGKV